MNTILNDFKYAWNRPNNAVAQIILINVIVFVALLLFNAIFKRVGNGEISVLVTNQFQLPSPISEFIFRPWTSLTYAFNHFGIWHLLINMIAFFWFGRLIQEYLGSQKLINIYVISALAGALMFLFVYNVIPGLGIGIMRGASGAIFGVMVAAVTLLPDYRFNLLLIGPVKIIYIALFFIISSFIGLDELDNVGGNLAHLTGAAIGWVYIKQLQKGNEMGVWVFKTMEFFKGLFKPRPKIKVSHRKKAEKASSKSGSTSTKSSVSQDEIDTILDKISEKGYESLSKEEKEKLFNASRK